MKEISSDVHRINNFPLRNFVMSFNQENIDLKMQEDSIKSIFINYGLDVLIIKKLNNSIFKNNIKFSNLIIITALDHNILLNFNKYTFKNILYSLRKKLFRINFENNKLKHLFLYQEINDKIFSQIYDSNEISNILNVINDKMKRYGLEYLFNKSDNIQFLQHNIVNIDNKLVMKIFFDNYSNNNLANELEARKLLDIPELIEITKDRANYCIMPFKQNIFKWEHKWYKFYPVEKAKKIMELVSKINQQGFSIIDWNPTNFLFDEDNNISVLDLEYFTKTYPATIFTESADYIGAKKLGFDGPCRHKCGYKDFWLYATGLPYNN